MDDIAAYRLRRLEKQLAQHPVILTKAIIESLYVVAYDLAPGAPELDDARRGMTGEAIAALLSDPLGLLFLDGATRHDLYARGVVSLGQLADACAARAVFYHPDSAAFYRLGHGPPPEYEFRLERAEVDD